MRLTTYIMMLVCLMHAYDVGSIKRKNKYGDDVYED